MSTRETSTAGIAAGKCCSSKERSSESFRERVSVHAAGRPFKTKCELDIAGPELSSIAPGVYDAYSRCATVGYHGLYKRWNAMVQFTVLESDLVTRVGNATWFFNLSSRERPQ